jgi:hypothetical protein
MRNRGSHHLLKRLEVAIMVNIQNIIGKDKPYQLKQFLALIEKNNLNV